jgi:hypothetical protein
MDTFYLFELQTKRSFYCNIFDLNYSRIEEGQEVPNVAPNYKVENSAPAKVDKKGAPARANEI